MGIDSANVQCLVEEYRAILADDPVCTNANDSVNWDRVAQRLVGDCEWTPTAALHLVRLIKDYGAFVLRNALAAAIALDIQDGELGI